MHDPRLLDELSRFPTSRFDAEVYRATPKNLHPLTPSTAGGRWSPRGSVPVLYTSTIREGALAEICFHWAQLDPVPTKPVVLHRLKAAAQKTLRLVELDLSRLGIPMEQIGDLPYRPTQDIGAAVAFLGCDGLIVPSARWKTVNFIIFAENNTLECDLSILESEELNWHRWAKENGFLDR